jgi:hypothetical protein
MAKITAKIGLVLLAISCVPILAYLMLLGASNVHVSGGLAGGPQNLIEHNFIWNQILQTSKSLAWLPQPRVTHVQTVGVLDAFRNITYIFCVSGLTASFLVLLFLAGLVKAVIGIVTASWASFGIGILTAILSPIFAVGVFLVAFLQWISLLFQPCTPGYAIVWILFGLPFFALGAPAGAAPEILAIVIVKY